MTDAPLPADHPGFHADPVLDGELVRLRRVTEADLPALLPMHRDPEAARLTGSHDADPDESLLHDWYAGRRDQGGRLDLAVVERTTGNVIGEAVLNEYDHQNGSCNFRIALVPGSHGRGSGTEATRLLAGHGFEVLGLHRISLEVYAFNPRARRVYEKVGFVTEGVLREALLWQGRRTDAAVMSILAPEWARHRGHPEAAAPGTH